MARHAAVNTANIQDAVEAALVEQPWFIRRKDSIVAVSGGILQVLNLLSAYAGGWPEWANVVIAALIFVIQAVVHAGTPGAITPSMADRLEDAAPTPERSVELDSTPFPVYSGPSSNPAGQSDAC